MDANKIGSATQTIITPQATESRAAQAVPIAEPGTAAATPADTARAEINSAALMTAMMAPTPDGIYAIGAAAMKVGKAISSAVKIGEWGGWGFWIFAAIIGLMVASQDASAATSCSAKIDQSIEASQITGGHHITFSTSDLASLAKSNAKIDSVILTLVIRKGDHDHDDFFDHGHDWDDDDKVFRKLKIAVNGVQTSCSGGRDFRDLIQSFLKRVDSDKNLKFWWWTEYWMHNLRFSFSKHRDSTVISVDLTDLLVNSQEQFRPYFERLLLSKGSLTLSLAGPAYIVGATIKVMGTGGCPTPSPSPTPTPKPTPMPSATPSPLAPITRIDSSSPAASPTNSTVANFTFSSDQTGVSFACSLDGARAELCSSPRAYSGVANGAHTFTVVATNSSGLSDPNGASYGWTVDTISPDVTISNVSPSSSTTNSSTIQMEFASSESGTFMCSIDGSTYTDCVSPKTYSGLGEGAHEVDVIATDGAGNTSLAPARYQWSIDQTVPVVNIVAVDPAASFTNRTDAAFTFAANESASFECSLDDTNFQSCVSPLTFNNLEEGQHVVSIRAIDVAGNVSSNLDYTWTIDVTSPQLITGNIVPAPNAETNATAVSAEFFSNENSTYTCSFDGAVAIDCTSPFSAAVTSDGTHVLTIQAKDLAGNMSEAVTRTWLMDYTNPQISFGVMAPSVASYINQSSLTVNVNSTEPVTFSGTIDGVDLGQTSSPILLTNLNDGAHILVLNAIDDAGNAANTITHSFTVDTVAPIATLNSVAVNGPTTQTSNSFTFSANESANFQCNFNGAGFANCASPYSVSGLVEGTHNVLIHAIDLAGNISNNISYSWTVDLTPPKTTISLVTPAGSVIASNSVSVAFSVSDPNASSQCSVDGKTFSSCSSPFSASGLADGNHTIQVRSVDQAGNIETTPALYAFRVDTAVPTITLTSSVGPATNSMGVAFTFVASEASTFTCSLDGAAQIDCTSPMSYNALANGSHTFTVVATNVVGTKSVPVSFSWMIDTTPPTTSISASQDANNSANITLTSSSNKSNVTYMCALDNAALAPCDSVTSYTDLSAGNHVFFARATDSLGNVDSVGATYNFVVEVPLTTTLTSTPPSSTNQSSASFSFISSDVHASFECSLNGSSFTACSSPQTYSSLVSGNYNFTVHAVSASGKVDAVGASYSWSVDNTAPVVQSISVTVTASTATIVWVTSEPTTTGLSWGLTTAMTNSVPKDNVYSTNHTLKLTGLSASTAYFYQPEGADQAGNIIGSGRRGFRTAAQ